MRSAMVLIRLSSSSRRPLIMSGSSSRMKWVKICRADAGPQDWAVTNMPHCVMSWARPTLRRNVDFPPEFAPVMITRDLPSASTSLPTTLSARSARLVSRRSVQENSSESRGDGTGKATGRSRA